MIAIILLGSFMAVVYICVLCTCFCHMIHKLGVWERTLVEQAVSVTNL